MMIAARSTPLLLLPLLAACASSPAPPEADVAGAGLYDGSTLPPAGSLAALQRRLSLFMDAPACVAGRVRLERDTAHALWLLADERALHASLARAFEQLGEPEYARSDAIAAAQPVAHAAALQELRAGLAGPADLAATRATGARAAFAALGDDLLVAEAELVLLSLRSEGATPPRPRCATQAAVAALLALRARLETTGGVQAQEFQAAARMALEAGHGIVLERLESLRALGAVPDVGGPEATRGWMRALAGVALERGAPLSAVRHALLAVRATESAASADLVLLARAYAAAGRAEDALIEAQLAVESAGDDPATRAMAEAAVGDALLRLEKSDDAASGFHAARESFGRAADATGAFRQGLNEAVACLKAGALAKAREVLAELGAAPEGPAVAELRARADVVATLVALLDREIGGAAAAARLERALTAARTDGGFSVIEDYAGLVERLRRSSTP